MQNENQIKDKCMVHSTFKGLAIKKTSETKREKLSSTYYHSIQENALEVIHVQQGQMLRKVEKDVHFKRPVFNTKEDNADFSKNRSKKWEKW